MHNELVQPNYDDEISQMNKKCNFSKILQKIKERYIYMYKREEIVFDNFVWDKWNRYIICSPDNYEEDCYT